MIKINKYNEEQISIIRSDYHLNKLVENLSAISLEDIPITHKRIDMLKIILLYMSLRKTELLNADIKKKDVDYIVKQELNHLNLVLKELNNAIPKSN